MITYILTGGTIGSSLGEDGVARPDSDLAKIIAGEDEIRRPYNILSENLDAKTLNLLIKETASVLDEARSEGMIITHGSDTIQYSAAILDHLFAGAGIPIVLVAANYVLSDPRSNGMTNLFFARRFIKEKRRSGVFVCYENPGEEVKIHRGRKLLPHEAFSDALKSINEEIYAAYSYDSDVSHADYLQIGINENTPPYNKEITYLDEEPGTVLRVEPYPGMEYPVIGNSVRAVLLGSYHSGTIGINDKLRDFVAAASERNIPVYLCGISLNATEYESIHTYEDLGIIPIYDVSPVSAYCGLWLKYSAV